MGGGGLRQPFGPVTRQPKALSNRPCTDTRRPRLRLPHFQSLPLAALRFSPNTASPPGSGSPREAECAQGVGHAGRGGTVPAGGNSPLSGPEDQRHAARAEPGRCWGDTEAPQGEPCPLSLGLEPSNPCTDPWYLLGMGSPRDERSRCQGNPRCLIFMSRHQETPICSLLRHEAQRPPQPVCAVRRGAPKQRLCPGRLSLAGRSPVSGQTLQRQLVAQVDLRPGAQIAPDREGAPQSSSAIRPTLHCGSNPFLSSGGRGEGGCREQLRARETPPLSVGERFKPRSLGRRQITGRCWGEAELRLGQGPLAPNL